MFELIPQNTKINFLAARKWAFIIAGLVTCISVGSLITRGLNFSIDFTGGVLLQVSYPESVELDPVRETLEAAGFPDATVQHFGTTKDVMIRVQPEKTQQDVNKLASELMAVLSQTHPDIVKRRSAFVGPQVGDELAYKGALASLFALIGIMIYVAARFQWKFGIGAIAATVHDVVFVLGMFSIFQLPFDLVVLGAVLAVVGYSLNDTVVIFDRIRENFRLQRRAEPMEVINKAINDTISRTIMTGVTALMVLVALYFIAGETLQPFSLALIIGILVGTASSIYIGSAVTLSLNVNKEDLMPPEQKDEAIDSMP